MSDAQAQEIQRLESELSRMSHLAEQHAYSVRQLIAQRSRHFTLFDLLGKVANFDNGQSLFNVVNSLKETGSQFLQEIFPLVLNRGKTNGFFVEFGACDGLLISNTWLLERDYGWTGILSEPSRSWHSALKANRNCILDFRCVHGESGRTVQFAESGEDATQSAIFGGEQSGAVAQTYTVETVSLRDLLREHNAPRTIDFLSVDVEGAEFDILKNFSFDEYRFEFACIEQMTEEQGAKIRPILKRAGYEQVLLEISGHDGFYVPADSAAFRVLSELQPA